MKSSCLESAVSERIYGRTLPTGRVIENRKTEPESMYVMKIDQNEMF